MFGLFKKSSSFKTTDKVWKTSAHAWRGMATDAMRIITQEEIPVVVYFFDEAKDKLVSYFASRGIPYYELNQESVAKSVFEKKTIFCVKANEAAQLIYTSLFDKNKIHFLFESHYPLVAPEQKVIDELFALTKTPVFTFYLSIDGPLMQVFDSGTLIPLMEKMGLKDDECVEHTIVSRSILRALEKIRESMNTPSEIPAPSESEWYARNARKRV